MAISSQKKFKFFDDSLSKPVIDSPYHEDWTANNHPSVGLIKQTIKPSDHLSQNRKKVMGHS